MSTSPAGVLIRWVLMMLGISPGNCQTPSARSRIARHLGPKEPVPRRGILAQVAAAGELPPAQLHPRSMNVSESGPLQAIGDLERLPEVLLQAGVAELAEGEIVQLVLAVPGGVVAGHRLWHACLPGP